MPAVKRLSAGWDTETTGIDLFHGCKPFLVSMARYGEDPLVWEWFVDPLTREPIIPAGDREEIRRWLSLTQDMVFQNAKFDIKGFGSIEIDFDPLWWSRVDDTLFRAHLIHSIEQHDLTSLVLKYLGIDIKPFEDAVQVAVNECREIARVKFPDWKIAKPHKKLPNGTEEYNPKTPSAGDTLWKWDMWLPRAIAKALSLPPEHSWWTVTRDYNLADSGVVLPLRDVQREIIEERGLTAIYKHRQELIRIIYDMESRGVTYNEERLVQLKEDFTEEAKESESICINLGEGLIESLPGSGTTKAMRELLIDRWKLEPLAYSEKTGAPSIDKVCLEAWEHELPARSKQGMFVRHLRRKRKRDTAVSYMRGYQRAGLRVPIGWTAREAASQATLWRLLHPSLNATGTATLRFSSSNPNEQNISKQDDGNLRQAFGPLPGREWWSLDYENLELRIPAYEAGERDMIDLFEHPERAPYYGSYHLLVAHILHPELFDQCLADGVTFKDRYKATWYQWTKNGNFAVQYGAMVESGTADAAYHVPGAQERIQSKFVNIAELNSSQIAYARENGYVTTMIDRELGAYPIQCSRDRYGRVRPTVPLNYHVQGTAMWAMCRAMVRCENFIQQWNASRGLLDLATRRAKAELDRLGIFITMQVHDELVFDLPAGNSPTANVPVILSLIDLMEESGRDIGIPLKVDASYHPNNWAKSVHVDLAA